MSKYARRTDPDTSQEAAEAVLAREATFGPRSHQARLLAVYQAADVPLADFEAAKVADLYRPGVCYWHRVGDLNAAGLLVDTGERRLNPDTGRRRRVLALTETGRSWGTPER